MKYIYSLIFSVLLFSSVSAQNINYEKSFKHALAKAVETNKPIFIIITPPEKAEKQVAKSGLSLPEVVAFYNKSFINFSVSASDTASKEIIKKYEVENAYPSFMILDSKGRIAYRMKGHFTIAMPYMMFANEAISGLNTHSSLVAFDDEYQNGQRDTSFLKSYILRRESLGLYDNAKLIDEYVNNITISSLQNYETVLFILKAGPYAYGKTYNLAYLNKKILDSVYKTEPIKVRQAINKHILINTFAEALKTKNRALAQEGANMSRAIWTSNYQGGNKAYNNYLIDYYKAVNDSSNYYRMAASYYESYMRISADSINKQKQQSKEYNEKLAAQRAAASKKNNSTPDSLKGQLYIAAPGCDCAPMVLNNAAYDFYTMGTHSPAYLTKAILWSKRSILLEPDNSNYYDTLAHLLYRLELYTEAEADQAKAVTLAISAKLPKQQIDKFKDELKLMKERKL